MSLIVVLKVAFNRSLFSCLLNIRLVTVQVELDFLLKVWSFFGQRAEILVENRGILDVFLLLDPLLVLMERPYILLETLIPRLLLLGLLRRHPTRCGSLSESGSQVLRLDHVPFFVATKSSCHFSPCCIVFVVGCRHLNQSLDSPVLNFVHLTQVLDRALLSVLIRCFEML